MRVFISYSHSNREVVQQLKTEIESWGFDVWWDQNIPPGADWEACIAAALNEADVVVAELSRSSLESIPCAYEHFEAFCLGKAFIPVIIDKDLQVPHPFSKIEYVNLVNNSPVEREKLEAALNQLAQPNLDLQQVMFERYVTLCLEKPNQFFNPQRARRYLSSIAREMTRNRETVFCAERLQPSEHGHWTQQMLYIFAVIMLALLTTLVVAWAYLSITWLGVFYSLGQRFSYGDWVISGELIASFIAIFYAAGNIAQLNARIKLGESLDWSREELGWRLKRCLLATAGAGIVSYFLYGLGPAAVISILYFVALGIAGEVGGGLYSRERVGIPTSKMLEASLQTWLVHLGLLGFSFALVFGLVFGLVSRQALIGIIAGMIAGIGVGLSWGYAHGGGSLTRHAALRLSYIFTKKGLLDYEPFLKAMISCGLMREVYGEYEFHPRSARHYFANSDW